MFSSYCIGKSVAYFEDQIRSVRTWLVFDRFCREISQTDHLIALCHEGVMSKRFYVIQKMIFGLCAYRHDRLAARLAWFFSKLIVLKKRKFLTGQFEWGEAAWSHRYWACSRLLDFMIHFFKSMKRLCWIPDGTVMWWLRKNCFK